MAIAHVDPVSLGVLEAPGNYGCAMAIGEGQPAGNAMCYGGPHYGFLAARSEFIRRLPGRIVGETVDVAGERGYVLTLQTREQHIRREKATSNITTNQTLLALAGLVHLSLLGPQGLRELGETCMALAGYAKERLVAAGLELVFPERATFKEFAVRTGRNAREALAAARAKGHLRRLPARARLSGARRRAARRGHREADGRGDRPARRGARGMKLIYEKSQPGRRGIGVPDTGPARARACRRSWRARTPPRLPELAEPEVLRHFTELSTRNFGIDTGFYPLGSCTMKYNPRINERLVALPGFANLHPLVDDDAAQGALELEWELQEILREVTGLDAVSLQPAAGQPGRADRPDAVPRLLRRSRRERAAPEDRRSPTRRTARTRRA